MRQLNTDKCKLHKLNKFLRREVNKSGWVKRARKCYITGSTNNLRVHHDGMSFSKISETAFKNLNIKYKGEFTECYSTTELILIKNEVLRLHKLYAKPITLTEDIHNELHRVYGTHVSHEQLEEFKAQYNNRMEVVA